jgi:hypothetical protein
MKQLTALTILILLPFANFSQISTGKVEDPKKKTETKTETDKSDKKYDPDKGMMDFTAFIGAGYSIGSHRLAENDGLFGRPVGLRADEKMVNRFTYQIGIRNRVHRFFSVEAGISLDRYGESYSFKSVTTDSSYAYDRKYNMLAVPVQLLFTYGKRVQFLAGVGLQPFIPFNTKTTTTIHDSLGNASPVSKIKTIEGLNAFGLSALFSMGIQYRFSKFASVYCIPAYSLGLTNIFSKQEPHKEWLSALNIRFGLAIHFPEMTKEKKPAKVKNKGAAIN